MRSKSVAYSNNNDVGEWLVYAIELRRKIQDKDLEIATNKLPEIAVEDYNWKLPTNSTQSPVNFEDIVIIILNKEWYNKNVALGRKQLWMMQDGMFRSNYDNWIHDFKTYWFEQHNVN
eukprot:15358677-Ditylum_brightwellii.AAC.1